VKPAAEAAGFSFLSRPWRAFVGALTWPWGVIFYGAAA